MLIEKRHTIQVNDTHQNDIEQNDTVVISMWLVAHYRTSTIFPSVSLLNAILAGVKLLIVIMCSQSAKCHHANCHSTEWYSGECNSAEFNYDGCNSAKCHSVEFHSSECHSSECHYF